MFLASNNPSIFNIDIYFALKFQITKRLFYFSEYPPTRTLQSICRRQTLNKAIKNQDMPSNLILKKK